MQYRQVGVSIEPRAWESLRLVFQIAEDPAAFDTEGYEPGTYPAWGFELNLEEHGLMQLRRTDALGSWVPLLALPGDAFFRELANPQAPPAELLAARLIDPMLQHVAALHPPPPHLRDAAIALVAQWFGAVPRNLVLRRTPLGRMRLPYFRLLLEAVTDTAEHPPLTLLSRDRDDVLTLELAGVQSRAPQGDWAAHVVDLSGEYSQPLAGTMLAPLLSALLLQSIELQNEYEVRYHLTRWIDENRASLLPPLPDPAD